MSLCEVFLITYISRILIFQNYMKSHSRQVTWFYFLLLLIMWCFANIYFFLFDDLCLAKLWSNNLGDCSCVTECNVWLKNISQLVRIHFFMSYDFPLLAILASSQTTFTCSKLTIETSEQGVKYVQREQ